MIKYLILLVAPIAFLLTLARADQNPAPVNVGLYNYSTFTVGTSTTIPILPKNPYRAGLILQNNGSSSIVIKPGSTPSSATDGLVITTGGYIQFSPVPTDAIYGKSASSTDAIIMMEFAK